MTSKQENSPIEKEPSVKTIEELVTELTSVGEQITPVEAAALTQAKLKVYYLNFGGEWSSKRGNLVHAAVQVIETPSVTTQEPDQAQKDGMLVAICSLCGFSSLPGHLEQLFEEQNIICRLPDVDIQSEDIEGFRSWMAARPSRTLAEVGCLSLNFR